MSRQISLTPNKKLRGIRRRIRHLLAMPASVSEFFPTRSPDPYWGTHWDYKLQINQRLVEGPNSRLSVKKLCMQTLLETSVVLKQNCPTMEFAKIVVSISYPAMFGSRVTVFFDDKYYSEFFERNSSYQTWIRLPPDRSLLREWNLPSELHLSEIGFNEIISDDDDQYQGEIWFYGDIPDNPAH